MRFRKGFSTMFARTGNGRQWLRKINALNR
ncbi:hypothetical protein MHY1_02144 [Methylovirgula sp. HY1]|nr:hypothetical protein MHY1_02144 [Methylovirgula sp. HY1]